MLYVFNCVKCVCDLPAVFCRECARICEGINCSVCMQGCDAVSRCCYIFVDKPLSSYVIIAVLLSLAELVSCALSFNDPYLANCIIYDRIGAHVGIHKWLALQMCFACLNLLFAPYFQARVWATLNMQMQLVAPMMQGVPMQLIQESFKQVFLHDIGVCFYFFILVCSFVWSLLGSKWIQTGMFCNPGNWPGHAAWLGMCFFWVAFVYSIFWYNCSCCAKSMDVIGSVGQVSTCFGPGPHTGGGPWIPPPGRTPFPAPGYGPVHGPNPGPLYQGIAPGMRGTPQASLRSEPELKMLTWQ